MKRQLSQQEIDAVFQKQAPGSVHAPATTPCDFRRLDRIPKSQIRAIRLLHDGFARTLASSLSVYLRSYLTVNLVSVEQLSYAEFLEGLPNPSCLVCLGLRPYEGHALLEVNPSLTFQILEIVLGGKARASPPFKRQITEIEQHLLDGFLRILLGDLKQAWETVTGIDFTVNSLVTEPQFLPVSDPGQAFLAVGIEMKIGETVGIVNLAFPSLAIKMMRNKFDQQGSLLRTKANEQDQAHMLGLIKPARLHLDARIEGPTLRMNDLLSLGHGDVLPLDYPLERMMDCRVNGRLKFRGRMVSVGAKKAFLVVETPG